MKKNRKVVIAMSGGVDSSVAAALLKERGYDCIGISMQLWDYGKREAELMESTGATGGSCCSMEDINDARGVANSLDIPFYVINMEEPFKREVVDYFVSDYLKGRTPNPCVKCNDVLKFRYLAKKAKELGADLVATGHYARVKVVGSGLRLLKGIDSRKDQSYFLFTMGQQELAHTVFPLGDLTKGEVREHARRLGLNNSEKEESQEICFVEDDNYRNLIRGASGGGELAAGDEGDIVDREGRRLGTHRGLFNYTIGQRRGINLSGGPWYVVALNMDSNELVVGPDEALFSSGLYADSLSWVCGEAPSDLNGVTAKIRYSQDSLECRCGVKGGGRLKVIFREPQRAVTPGQALVLYRGDEVLGGGWIDEAID